jgi:hypothetical protein
MYMYVFTKYVHYLESITHALQVRESLKYIFFYYYCYAPAKCDLDQNVMVCHKDSNKSSGNKIKMVLTKNIIFTA